jgi:hypothetical protein
VTPDKKDRDDSNDSKGIVFLDSAIEEIIPGFLENRSKDIKLILDALNRNDFVSIAILGRSMKGHGIGCGFEGIEKIGGAIEQAAKNKNFEEIKRSLKELKNDLKQIEIFYKSI